MDDYIRKITGWFFVLVFAAFLILPAYLVRMSIQMFKNADLTSSDIFFLADGLIPPIILDFISLLLLIIILGSIGKRINQMYKKKTTYQTSVQEPNDQAPNQKTG